MSVNIFVNHCEKMTMLFFYYYLQNSPRCKLQYHAQLEHLIPSDVTTHNHSPQMGQVFPAPYQTGLAIPWGLLNVVLAWATSVPQLLPERDNHAPINKIPELT